MKIEKKNPKKVVAFGDVLAGTVFRDKNEAVCMKIAGTYGQYILCRNAINLDTGSLYSYDDDEEVEILEDAILTY